MNYPNSPITFSLKYLTFSFFFVFLISSARSVSSYELLSTDNIRKYYQILLPKVVGPESIAFDCNGQGPYVGVSDGRILRWQGSHVGWTEFAIPTPNRERKLCDGSTDPKMEQVCGRPLGLKFNNATCELYIADAYYGLLKVGPRGGVAKQLATSCSGVPFRLTNGLDVDPLTGTVYFTDSSIHFQRREFMVSIASGDTTGRLMKYDPQTKKVTILKEGLSFPNGLALSKDKSFLVVAETGKLQLLRIWIKGPKSQTLEIFSELARYPDNIKTNQKGEFWVALNSLRGPLKWDSNIHVNNDKERSSLRQDEIPWFTQDPVAIKFDEDGKVVEVMDGKWGKTFESVSEVEENGAVLWIGSVRMPYLGKIVL